MADDPKQPEEPVEEPQAAEPDAPAESEVDASAQEAPDAAAAEEAAGAEEAADAAADEEAASDADARPAADASAEEAAPVAERAAAEADDEADADEGDSDEAARREDSDEEPEAPARRRGAAETTTRHAEEPRAAPTDAAGEVEVRARARYVRRAPRKARLVMDHIRGKRVGDARAILSHTTRAAAVDVSKLLESAIANAENNFELDPDDLRVRRATVDEGPTIKRYRPRALGRATPIDRRTSHMTITLTTTGEAGDARKAGK